MADFIEKEDLENDSVNYEVQSTLFSNFLATHTCGFLENGLSLGYNRLCSACLPCGCAGVIHHSIGTRIPDILL